MTGFNPESYLNALIYAITGIVIFFMMFAIVDRMHPADFWKEIIEHKNTGLAILLGLMSLGICIIIAAAVH